ncbi:fam-a protein [Plasmodium vinckei lentum]|uniref:Fam-a protein n=1 Tax=Plasmodium vinckei lentum TaxID=138297 RepID=A0A6V7SKJ5_PLAVN|nr:fam-a protein [Plasmodium vinckei lentum]
MNKFYIQIVLFLLSVSVYLSNKTLATEPAPRNAATPRSIPDKDTSDEVYNKHEHLLCTDPKEIAQAIEFKKEAVLKLMYYAIDTNDPKSGKINPNTSTDSCKKKDEYNANDPKSGKINPNTSTDSCKKKDKYNANDNKSGKINPNTSTDSCKKKDEYNANDNKSGKINPNTSTDSCKKKDEYNANDPKSGKINPNTSTDSCKKKDKYHDVIKVNFQIDDPNKYNKIINKLWDPDYPDSFDHPNSSDHSCSSKHSRSSKNSNYFNTFETKTKIVRVYNPNLVMIQRRINNPFFGCQKYFYALATKVQISKDKAVIVMASVNINDHNSQNTISYKNPIIESANLFEADIDSDEDIKSGKLIKTFVNISGHLIEKKDNCVDITYVTSINGLMNLSINEPSENP